METTVTYNTTAQYDYTEEMEEEGPTYTRIIILISYIAVFLLGTTGNALVIYVTGYKMKTTVNTIWFLNLALADFLFTFFLLLNIISISQHYNWPFGVVMCKFNTFVSVINMFASIFLLTAISLDRCLSTWSIVWIQNKRTPLKARVACFCIWMGAVVCSVPFVTYRQLIYAKATYCTSSPNPKAIKNLTIFRFVVGFLIPFIIIICSYIAIGVRASKLQRQKKLRPFRVILTVILAFFLCWLPFHIQQILLITHNDNPSIHKAGEYLVNLAYLNSCLNPILYVFMCEEFKSKLKRSLLLVLEGAFTEEHLHMLTSRASISSRHSEPHIYMNRNGTSTSLSSRLEKATSSEE